MRSFRRGRRKALYLAVVAGLAACGNQPSTASTPPTPPGATAAAGATTSNTPTLPASWSITQVPGSPTPRDIATTSAPALPSEVPTAMDASMPVVASGPFAGIPQDKTPEGYPMLGAADAPVTLVMYSDFL